LSLHRGERAFVLKARHGDLDAVSLVPDNPVALVVLAHGAGAGLRHNTMEMIAAEFARQQLATLRFNFPYMQAGKNRVDNKEVSVATIAAAAEYASTNSQVPLFLGGHSFGGRMASHAVAEEVVLCSGLIFCSFPLHGAKKPDDKRAAHMPDIASPMLFLSGTRDDLGDRDLLTALVKRLKRVHTRTRIHWLETANHSYVVLKRTRTNPMPVFAEMAQQACQFVDEVID
jgi:predicted alpha/beta-hydrolase family hydrolase